MQKSHVVKLSKVSLAQRSLWFINQCYPEVGLYNMEDVYKVPNELDLTLLERAINLLTIRHELMRCLYLMEDTELRRHILPEWQYSILKTPVGDISDEELEEKYIVPESRVPFNLSETPPKRFLFFKRNKLPSVFMILDHHIQYDMISSMLFMNELKIVYTALHQNKEPQLAPLKYNFDHFIETQERYLASSESQQDQAYWIEEIKKFEPKLELPKAVDSENQKEFQRGYLSGHINRDIQSKITQLSETLKTSEYSLYFSAYLIVLHKFTGQHQLTVGTPTAGRETEHSDLYGYFINLLLINAAFDPEKTIQECIQALTATITDALKHKKYPLALLAERLAIERSGVTGILCQSTFSWRSVNGFYNRDTPLVKWNPDGSRHWNLGQMGQWEALQRQVQLDEIDLGFNIYKFDDSRHWGIEYNQQLLDSFLVEELAASYEEVLGKLTANLNTKLSKFSVLCPNRVDSMLKIARGPRSQHDIRKTFIDYFQEKVQQSPYSIAVTFQQHNETYTGLNHRANRIANWLIQQKVSPGEIVAVSLKRSIDLIACILGIMKTGAAYLPLDSEYPKERINFMIEDAEVAGVITDNANVYSLYGNRGGFRCLFEGQRQFSTLDSENPIVKQSPEDLAYIIYTSGSTGKPKGVEILQRCLSTFTHSVHTAFKIPTESNVLQFSSINFDASLFELAASLTTGSTLHMAAKESLLGEDLIQFLEDKKINVAHLPTAIVASTTPHKPLPDFHSLMSGGERCAKEIIERWSEGRTFFHVYGPTETTVYATQIALTKTDHLTIGKALPNAQVYILDSHLQPVPLGVVGEIYIGGDSVAKGYLNRPELTNERFLPDPFRKEAGAQLYKTGDLARYIDDGTIEFSGRSDHQVKIRGFRVEMDEISEILLSHPCVHDALIMAREDIPGAQVGAPLLAAYIVKNASESITSTEISNYLRDRLPEYMLPTAYAILDAFPLTPNDKIDRKALPIPDSSNSKKIGDVKAPRNELERIIASVWQHCLGIKEVCISENFFDLGGHSLLVARVHSELPEHLRCKLRLVDLFQYPTIQSLAHYLEGDEEEDSFFLQQDDHAERLRLRRRLMESIDGSKIAIVGMAGRFPGADSVDAFWENICGGKESITFYKKEELLEAGVPEELIQHPNYVPAKGALSHIDLFDADFFGFTPREAQITDPQQRIFLECAWQTLEDACCVPEKFKGRIGVFAGMGMNQYLTTNLSTHPDLRASVGDYPMMIGNDKDFLSTRVAYKLNLNGPALVLQTACSTSLVAVHTACQAILSKECDAALAGGVSLGALGPSGYLYQEGMIMSPDGHCRAFDAQAQGTVVGQGCGLVLLKPLDEALKSNDNIYAVIAGSSINNDGSNKTGYTAPSVDGQANVVNAALATANIESEKVSYIETHGTGTAVGDPIEIEGLRKAYLKASKNSYKQLNEREPHCALGSVKTNIGHVDVASGITGLIKAAKTIHTHLLPPSLHYTQPNPKIDFENTPFFVNTELRAWEGPKMSRYAGVSSFGLGGTNAHVVLAEPPSQTKSDNARHWHILTLSARTPEALEQMTRNLADHLKENEQRKKHKHRFENICYALHVGRKDFPHRRYLVCHGANEAIAELSAQFSNQVITSHYTERPKKIVFMFPGQGSQYINMGKHLYGSELLFRENVDHCRQLLNEKFIHYEELTDQDHRGLTDRIHETHITQPSIFIFEYSMAQLLMSWNIKPDCMIGHSFGEFAAACIAGVFTLEQALELVTIRGHLIQGLEGGDMLMVNLSEEEAETLTNHDVSLAAINGPNRCVLSGTKHAINYLHQQLDERGIDNRILYISHAFHSHLMEPILERFKGYVARRTPQAPKIPFTSSLTGDWITDEQAMSAQYWTDHLRYAVQLNKGLQTIFGNRADDTEALATKEQLICLEVGPGKSLTTLAGQHPGKQPQDLVMATTRHAYQEVSDLQFLLKVLAKLWEQGVDIDWEAFHSARQCYRVPLPTYPFERKSYWVKPRTLLSQASEEKLDISSTLVAQQRSADNFKLPARNQQDLPRNDIENKVYQLWKATLGDVDFGIYDNFFDIGGDSLVAVNLVRRLKEAFKSPITTPILIRKPTVAELSEYILSMSPANIDKQIKEDEASPVVMIQEGKPGRIPVIMVHPVGGDVFFYKDLAHNLGANQPMYGFQALSLSGMSDPINSVSVMADFYIQELKRNGLNPPYVLGGSSFGGMVAYEMAQRLQDSGEDIKLLIMIDTPAPLEMPTHVTTSAAILTYLLGETLQLDQEALEPLDETAQIDYVLEAARVQGKGDVLPEHLGIPLFRTWFAHQQANRSYTPQPYEGDVIYFRHTEPQAHFPPLPHLPWEALIGGSFEVHQTPGNHITMNYPPNVQKIGEHLKPVLNRLIDAMNSIQPANQRLNI